MHTMTHKKYIFFSIVTVALLMSLSFNILTFRAAAPPQSDSANGEVPVGNVAPEILSTTFAAAINPETGSTLSFELRDNNTMEDLANVYVLIWDNDSVQWDGSDSINNHYNATWDEATDTWTESPGTSYFINPVDPGAGANTTQQYTFQIDFVASTVAIATDDQSWLINITVVDDTGLSATLTGEAFNVNTWISITADDASFTFTSASPGTNDTVIATPVEGYLDITVVSNFAYQVQVQAASATMKSGVHAINIGNVTHYNADTVGSSVALTTSWVNLGGSSAHSKSSLEAGDTDTDSYLWVDIPAYAVDGTYTFTLNIQVILSAYS